MAFDRKAIALVIATVFVPVFEGTRQVFYYDPPGIPTVCYGHTGADIDKNKVYSLAECKALLTKDMTHALRTVESCRPNLSAKTLAAWSSAVYNLGPTIVCNQTKSTAARLLAAGKLREACLQLTRWNRASVGGVSVVLPGLTKRRNAEMKLCLEGLE